MNDPMRSPDATPAVRDEQFPPQGKNRARAFGPLLSQCALVALCAAASAVAQEFPARPVRLIVGFPPAGAADILARIVAQRLTENLRQPVIVDNRPGAGSSIGAEIAAKASPDGYTLLMISSSHVISAGLYSQLGYHPVESFAPVMQVASAAQVLLANRSFPARSVGELVSLARAKPAQVTFASSGSGSTTHLAAELFKSMAGVDLVHVPYKGGAPALTDVIGGRVDLMFLSLPPALPAINAGRVGAIAVTSTRRSAALPRVPTVAESGVPGFEVSNWYGILAPAGTPAPVVSKLQAELLKVVQAPDITAAFLKQGAEPETAGPTAFRRYMAAETKKWLKVIRDAGIRAN